MVELRQVSKQINGQMILHPLDFALKKGEFVAIVGPSGSGKSTLLRMIAGLDHPSSGTIQLNGQAINQLAPAQRDIAMVFQDYALYPHMTVYDNMAYGLKMRKFSANDIRARVEGVANRLGLTPQLNQKPHSLSGGQQQRVAMGRALVRTPSLYLFDEPLSNLDVSLRAQLRMEIKQLHQTSKITSLYVTHDQMEAMTLASKILILNHGRIEQFDTPAVVYAKPANRFVGTFIGPYPMNFIAASVDLENKKLDINDELSIPLPMLSQPVATSDKVWIGIRPEDMRVAYEEVKGLKVSEIYSDDMGADLLVRVRCELTAAIHLVRLSGREKRDRKIVSILFDKLHAHLFLTGTGERIGGWDEEG
jgi:sn-glycerol 3-phosphate transport system ATP-binding protein